MANQSGKAYALTTLCPIINGVIPDNSQDRLSGQSYTAYVRDVLEGLGLDEKSPLAKIPNTYLCRFYLLTDLNYGGKPNAYDELKSDYLVFTANFHGDLEKYLTEMWNHAEPTIRTIWKYCVGFEQVHSAPRFLEYIQKCQVETTFFFNGSNDEPLEEQLKGLYLKQEFARFAVENQGKPPAELQRAFREFAARTQPARSTESKRTGEPAAGAPRVSPRTRPAGRSWAAG